VMIDGEHGALGRAEIAGLIRACEGAGITPIVRVPRNAPDEILAHLDAGALGIVIPNVNTKREAERAVSACKYWPEGNRGCGYGHALDWLMGQPFSEYIKDANEQIMVLPQIESKEGLENLEEILEVPGIDVIWPGPADLAHALGVPGQLGHPTVKEALDRIRSVTLATNRYLCWVAPDGEVARQAIVNGAHVINYGVHRLLIAGAKEYMTKARADQ
jgi:4-hydroxy-2-oxoheptanedioate aldolase